MTVPSKIHTIQLVKIQSEEMLAATSELNLAPSLVTGCCEAREIGYWAATQVKGLSTEITIVSEADVVHLPEGSTLIAVSPNLRSWDIAKSSGTWRGDESPMGSETVAQYQRDSMGTRETQGVLLSSFTNDCEIYGIFLSNFEPIIKAESVWDVGKLILELTVKGEG